MRLRRSKSVRRVVQIPLRATALQLGLQSCPGDSLAPIPLERCKTAIKLLLLRKRQGNAVVVQAIAKLCHPYGVSTLLRRDSTNDFLRRSFDAWSIFFQKPTK